MGMVDGKRVLITGARKGIGRGIALRLAAEGADIGINDLLLDHVTETTVAAIESLGRKATVHRGDMSDAGAIKSVVEEFVAMHGGIDVLVNNAMFPDQSRPFFDVDEAYWDRTMNLSLKGYFFAAQAAARVMSEQGTGGSIVCMSSVHSYTGRKDWTAYGVAKAGLRRMAKGLAADLAGTGIRSNCIAPGPIRNDLPLDLVDLDPEPYELDRPILQHVPLKYGGLPTDIANAVLFLASDMGRFVNGETILVDGGLEAVRMDM